ncbi:Biopolymer transport protein ExbD/TolR [Gemmata sp. SH-PL17]|uniref:ExbD/TolR family protein n=1 Tax=Gemmata sp. SH-PL17 TaxID=1630693 RepID=UPI0004AF0748|nr:biopolymer transporter ExbD [Gemmata sp. SH-PL17]AMV26813.1 Biopolymer transport protein ExbD/TolR [Gemmata sp. SH-PL17]
MAAIPKAFDVWFVAANTVYKAVPYNVVADWTQQGRLARTDKVRPAGTTTAWVAISDYDLLADYLARPSPATAAPAPLAIPDADDQAPASALPAEPAPVELPDPEPGERIRRPEDDDEVDMIPLIDISMVLLVFFIMIQAAGALAPVDVPEMKYAGQLTSDPDAVTITIEKLNTEDVYYAVRVGNVAPKPSHDQLRTPEEALKALNEVLVGVTRPPEVRIACRKDLPRERVYELRRELEPLRKKGIINSTVATVVEAPEK